MESGHFVSVNSELVSTRRPGIIAGVCLQHADNTVASEQQEPRAMPHTGKLHANIADGHVRLIAPASAGFASPVFFYSCNPEVSR
jgi:hypothetical protein